MIGIFLFWLAFSPVKPAPETPAVPRQEHLQHQKESPVFPQKTLSGTSIAENIRRGFDRQLQLKSHAGTKESLEISRQLTRFYSARSFQPVWTKPLMVSELIQAVDGAIDDGLDPADYHISEIKEFYSKPPATPEMQARYDFLLSDAFFTLANHLRYGKVDPISLDPDWNLNNTVSISALDYRLQNAVGLEGF
jgi:murein L,D-transpeptidase YcbB/YkuD